MKDQPLATIEFPNGSRVFLGEDRRWSGEDRELVRITNSLMDHLPDEYRPDWSHDIAYELAAEMGGKVIQAVKHDTTVPPGAAA